MTDNDTNTNTNINTDDKFKVFIGLEVLFSDHWLTDHQMISMI